MSQQHIIDKFWATNNYERMIEIFELLDDSLKLKIILYVCRNSAKRYNAEIQDYFKNYMFLLATRYNFEYTDLALNLLKIYDDISITARKDDKIIFNIELSQNNMDFTFGTIAMNVEEYNKLNAKSKKDLITPYDLKYEIEFFGTSE